MKATASLLALAIFVVAPSSALADPARHHHDYYKLVNVGSAGAAASNSFPWTAIGVGFAIAAVAALLLTTLLRIRRTGAYGH
jgi:hypothetical protein